VEAHEWVLGLEKYGTLKLFKMTHFKPSNKINACVKVFLSCIHGGTLWLDPPVSIDIILVARITGLRKEGKDPSLLFH
jgi:hypothetical protein